jgi:hypothetical protein
MPAAAGRLSDGRAFQSRVDGGLSEKRVVRASYYCANPSESMLPFTVVA